MLRRLEFADAPPSCKVQHVRVADRLNDHPMALLHKEFAGMTISAAASMSLDPKDLAEQLAAAFEDSVRVLSGLENRSDGFRAEREDRDDRLPPVGDGVALGGTTSVAAALMRQGDVEVIGEPGLGCCYVDRELYPTRRLAPGHAGRIMDLLLRNSLDGTPIFAELKTISDKHALAALVQLLRYAVELSTPSQRRRMALHLASSFEGVDLEQVPVDLYLLIQPNERSKERQIIIDRTEQVSVMLMQRPELRAYVRKIVCLDVPTALDGTQLTLRKRFAAGHRG